jgi:hypothetical protein
MNPITISTPMGSMKYDNVTLSVTSQPNEALHLAGTVQMMGYRLDHRHAVDRDRPMGLRGQRG